MAESTASRPGASIGPSGLRTLPLLRNLVVDAALPWIALQIMERWWHVPLVPALAIASIFPGTSILLSWIRNRRPDFIGMAVLATICGGIGVALLIRDPRYAVLKAAPVFGVFGVACLVSLGWRRPLMFFVSREFTARGDPAKAAAWTERLGNPRFRSAMRRLTIVWGLVCLLEAAVGITVAFLLPPSTALVIEPVLGIGTIAGLLAWTVAYARRRSAAAAEAAAFGSS
jgi:hypothetical protein